MSPVRYLRVESAPCLAALNSIPWQPRLDNTRPSPLPAHRIVSAGGRWRENARSRAYFWNCHSIRRGRRSSKDAGEPRYHPFSDNLHTPLPRGSRSFAGPDVYIRSPWMRSLSSHKRTASAGTERFPFRLPFRSTRRPVCHFPPTYHCFYLRFSISVYHKDHDTAGRRKRLTVAEPFTPRFLSLPLHQIPLSEMHLPGGKHARVLSLSGLRERKGRIERKNWSASALLSRKKHDCYTKRNALSRSCTAKRAFARSPKTCVCSKLSTIPAGTEHRTDLLAQLGQFVHSSNETFQCRDSLLSRSRTCTPS